MSVNPNFLFLFHAFLRKKNAGIKIDSMIDKKKQIKSALFIGGLHCAHQQQRLRDGQAVLVDLQISCSEH